MSDYGGDDASDFGDEEYYYVEEEYMVADDLAEHAVQSPPPSAYIDEELEEEWDRFDYFNDLEYASDGYDTVRLVSEDGKGAKVGSKRKRGVATTQARKKRKLEPGRGETKLATSPVIWRSRKGRSARPRMLTENAETYTLLKDWRERLADRPLWPNPSASAELAQVSEPAASEEAISERAMASDASPTPEPEDEATSDTGIDATALMAVLQERLAAANGPLGGMDPQQLLQFAMRMAAAEGTEDDIAGELADEMLDQGEDDDDEAEANLLSWVAQQRNAGSGATGNSSRPAMPGTPEITQPSDPPLTPPSSEANRSIRVVDDLAVNDAESGFQGYPSQTPNMSRKRKVAGSPDAGSAAPAKKRATRSPEVAATTTRVKIAPPTASKRTGRANR